MRLTRRHRLFQRRDVSNSSHQRPDLVPFVDYLVNALRWRVWFFFLCLLQAMRCVHEFRYLLLSDRIKILSRELANWRLSACLQNKGYKGYNVYLNADLMEGGAWRGISPYGERVMDRLCQVLDLDILERLFLFLAQIDNLPRARA